MNRSLWLFSLLFAVVVDAAAQQSGILVKEHVFDQAPFAQCHASTIAEGKNGLVIVWFAGTREKNPDVGVWVSRQVDGKWTAPVEIDKGLAKSPDGKEEDFAAWNPVLFQRPDGDLYLYYKLGLNPREWWGVYKTSSDGGKTWSGRKDLPTNIFGPIKNKPVLLKDGTLLSGSSTEDEGWRVHFEWTKDWGKTWKRTKAINDGKIVGAIQPALLTLRDGSVMALGRSQQNQIWQSRSTDKGKTWSDLRLLDLPNPNSGIDAVTTKKGLHVIVYNHTLRGRSPLNVAVSQDGAIWEAAAVLEHKEGEYSYPAVIQTKDGLIHITYTWLRKRVNHIVLDLEKLPRKLILHGKWPR
ncbi:MAG: sialidase family protein [Limisphaerales bacterium]